MGLMKTIFGGDGMDGGRISAWHVWSWVLKSALSTKSNHGPVRDKNLYASSSAMFSGRDLVTYMYIIDEYPEKLPIGFRERIRRMARGDIRVSFVTNMEHTVIPWDSAQMQSKMRVWRKAQNDLGNVDEYNAREKMAASDNQDRRSESLLYLADADQRKRREMFVVRSMMLVSGSRGEEFDEAISNIEGSAKKMGLRISRVTSDIEMYLQSMSPFSMQLNDKVKSRIGNPTLTDEHVARFSSYEHGRVGHGSFYMGTDVESEYPVFKEVKRRAEDAENILITAETGGGKSYYIKILILQFLGNHMYNGTIMDIEGDEYTPLAKYVEQDYSVITIDMAEGSGSYFDTCEITRVSDPALDKDMYSLSKSATTSIFRTLNGEVTGETAEWVGPLINNTVSQAYADRGVTTDPDTWHLSKGMTLHEVYGTFRKNYMRMKMTESGELTGEKTSDFFSQNPLYQAAYDQLMNRLSTYFEEDGAQAHQFSQRVSLEDIAHAKLVVCSFGMKARSASTVDPVQMALAQSYAAHISHMRAIFSKVEGKFNFKVWEEFQRWGQFPGSEVTINTALTGGRKMGDVNFIVTNNLAELMASDKFSILENVTSVAIGAIGNSATRKEICERLSINHMLKELDKVTIPDNDKGDGSGFGGEDGDGGSSDVADSKYAKSFLVYLDRKDVALVKMDVPERLAKSDILRTGVDTTLNKESRGSSSSRQVDW